MIRKNIISIVTGFKLCLYYLIGNIVSVFFYDRKYLQGKYFSGRFMGITSFGWKWVVEDGFSRIFLSSNKNIPWPVSCKVTVTNYQNINFHPDDLHIFHTYGTYFQAIDGKINIGKGTWIAPNVGLITTNHDIHNLDKHSQGKDINIGEKCWIGMNSVLLPGVTIGNNTIVGAGSVVTKSFEQGNCVIAGNPARKIKEI